MKKDDIAILGKSIIAAIKESPFLSQSEGLGSTVALWEKLLGDDSDWVEKTIFEDTSNYLGTGAVNLKHHTQSSMQIELMQGNDEIEVIFQNGFVKSIHFHSGDFFSASGHFVTCYYSYGIVISWEKSEGYFYGRDYNTPDFSWPLKKGSSNGGYGMSQTYREKCDLKFYEGLQQKEFDSITVLKKIHEQGYCFCGKIGKWPNLEPPIVLSCFSKRENKYVSAVCIWSDEELFDGFVAKDGSIERWNVVDMISYHPTGWQLNTHNHTGQYVDGFKSHVIINPFLGDDKLEDKVFIWEDVFGCENYETKSATFVEESPEKIAQDVKNVLLSIRMTGVLYFSGYVDDDLLFYSYGEDYEFGGKSVSVIPVFCNKDKAFEYQRVKESNCMDCHRVEEFYTAMQNTMYSLIEHRTQVYINPSTNDTHGEKRLMSIEHFLHKLVVDNPIINFEQTFYSGVLRYRLLQAKLQEDFKDSKHIYVLHEDGSYFQHDGMNDICIWCTENAAKQDLDKFGNKVDIMDYLVEDFINWAKENKLEHISISSEDGREYFYIIDDFFKIE